MKFFCILIYSWQRTTFPLIILSCAIVGLNGRISCCRWKIGNNNNIYALNQVLYSIINACWLTDAAFSACTMYMMLYYWRIWLIFMLCCRWIKSTSLSLSIYKYYDNRMYMHIVSMCIGTITADTVCRLIIQQQLQ